MGKGAGKVKWMEVDRSLIDDISHFVLGIESGKQQRIAFDFFHGRDTINNVINEMFKDAISLPIENIDAVKRDMNILVSTHRIKRIEYD
ncbi:MAG: hypothetical protein CME10_14835 [Gemmatimonadetes bacterium]|nr:hypothetical protein [Gemmatimonadota bacterium]